MRSFAHTAAVVLFFHCLLALSGCGAAGDSRVTFQPTGKHKMEEIASMLAANKVSNVSPPARLDDLEPFEPNLPLSAAEIRSGEIVYIWGAGLSTAPAAANTILAYEKKASIEGGWVLMQDGTAKQMTTEGFNATPKAR